MTYQEFLELRDCLCVVGHESGRIRLKFDMRVLAHPALLALPSLASDPATRDSLRRAGFIHAHPNLLTRTIVLEYDPERIAPDVLDTFFSSADMVQVTRLAQQVAGLLGITLHQPC